MADRYFAAVAIAGYFINYAVETRPGTSNALGAKFLAGAQGAFAGGRFIGAFVMKKIRPRWVFLAFITAVIAFLGASSREKGNTGIGTSRILLLTSFYPSAINSGVPRPGLKRLTPVPPSF